MPGIIPDVVCHHLSVNPDVKLVVQRKRKLGEERKKDVDEEVKNYSVPTSLVRSSILRGWLTQF